MFVVGKLDLELPFISWFGSLARAVRFAETEASLLARRRAHVTDSANNRTRPHERLSREELRSMTTNTGVMVWKIGDIRKVALGSPGRRDLVTGIAPKTFVRFR